MFTYLGQTVSRTLESEMRHSLCLWLAPDLSVPRLTRFFDDIAFRRATVLLPIFLAGLFFVAFRECAAEGDLCFRPKLWNFILKSRIPRTG